MIVGQINSDGSLRNVNVFGGFPGTILDLHMSMNGDALLCSFSLNGSIPYSIYGTNFPSGTFGIDGFLVNINPTTLADNWINHYTGSFFSETMINGIGDAIDPVTFNPIVIIGGTFAESVDLNPGVGTATINSTTWDGFIAKYSLSSGAYLQHAVIGSNNYNYINTLKLGGIGTSATIYIGGTNNFDCDFDPGVGVVNLPNVQFNEGFVASYDLNLALKNATSLRGYNQQIVTDITIISTNGNTQIGIIGESDGNIAFDTENGTDTIYQVNPTSNIRKAFVLFMEETASAFAGKNGFFIESGDNRRRKTIGSPKNSLTESIGFSVAYNLVGSIPADMNGSYNDVLYTNTSSPITKTDILIGHYSNDNCKSNNTLTIATCDASYDFNGNILATGGTYTASFINSNGCDSIVTLNLSFLQATSGSETIIGCGSVTSNSGTIYTTSGVYTETFMNAVGCDSIATINVTVNAFPTATVTINTDNSITSSAGATYQWLDCSTNEIIVGETESELTPSSNGTYAVIVTSISGCSDTSECVSISTIGLEENLGIELNIFPNPSNGKLTIHSINNPIEIVSIYTIEGQLISVIQVYNNEASIELYQPAGTYLLKISTSVGTATKRIILQ